MYAGLGPTEVRELRQLREEHGRLKKLVADLTLDTHLTEVYKKSFEASSAPGSRHVDPCIQGTGFPAGIDGPFDVLPPALSAAAVGAAASDTRDRDGASPIRLSAHLYFAQA